MPAARKKCLRTRKFLRDKFITASRLDVHWWNRGKSRIFSDYSNDTVNDRLRSRIIQRKGVVRVDSRTRITVHIESRIGTNIRVVRFATRSTMKRGSRVSIGFNRRFESRIDSRFNHRYSIRFVWMGMTEKFLRWHLRCCWERRRQTERRCWLKHLDDFNLECRPIEDSWSTIPKPESCRFRQKGLSCDVSVWWS